MKILSVILTVIAFFLGTGCNATERNTCKMDLIGLTDLVIEHKIFEAQGVLRCLDDFDDPQAYYLTGFIYLFGVNIKENAELAVINLEMATSEQHVEAAALLGGIYTLDIDQSNFQQGILLLEFAAENGSYEAATSLHNLFYNDKYQNKRFMNEWFNRALAKNHPNALYSHINRLVKQAIEEKKESNVSDALSKYKEEEFRYRQADYHFLMARFYSISTMPFYSFDKVTYHLEKASNLGHLKAAELLVASKNR